MILMAQGPIKRGDKEGVDYLSVFLAGTVGGAVQLGVACPVELVKVSINQKSNQQPALPGEAANPDNRVGVQGPVALPYLGG